MKERKAAFDKRILPGPYASDGHQAEFTERNDHGQHAATDAAPLEVQSGFRWNAEAVVPTPNTAEGAAVYRRMLQDVAEKFGGYTAAIGDGGWISPKDGQPTLLKEANVTLRVAVNTLAEVEELRLLLIDRMALWGERWVHFTFYQVGVHYSETAANRR